MLLAWLGLGILKEKEGENDLETIMGNEEEVFIPWKMRRLRGNRAAA